MSRLCDALLEICQDFTVDDLADAVDLSRTTAGRWLKSLRDDRDIGAWSAPGIEALAAFELRRFGTARISAALGPDQPRAPVGVDPTTQAQRLQRQMLMANRRNDSLALLLSTAQDRRALGRQESRELVEKADIAIQETAQQLALLKELRESLVQRLRSGD